MKTNIHNIYARLFIISVLLSSCSNATDNSSESTATQKGDQKQTQELNKINDLANNLIGLWQLDSSSVSASDMAAATGGGTMKQSDLTQNAKLINGNIVTYYQSKYSHPGDQVKLDEFKNNGKHISTLINDRNQEKTFKKSINLLKYSAQEKTVYETWEDGTKTTFEVIFISTHNLVYKAEGFAGFLTNYFSKINSQDQESVDSEVKILKEDTIAYYQQKWDAVKLIKEDGFPQYELYQEALQKINEEMLADLESDPNFRYDSPSKLNKLRQKFCSSKKLKDALKNYYTYGQPATFDLEEPCKNYLRDNLNDPGSLEVNGFKILGQAPSSWLCVMQYRAKNAYGALVMQQTTFDVKFNPANKYFFVSHAN